MNVNDVQTRVTGGQVTKKELVMLKLANVAASVCVWCETGTVLSAAWVATALVVFGLDALSDD